jgi:hypothetical protein
MRGIPPVPSGGSDRCAECATRTLSIFMQLTPFSVESLCDRYGRRSRYLLATIEKVADNGETIVSSGVFAYCDHTVEGRFLARSCVIA